jgi:CO dehydrogenase nickel-insertion accessory protein CooC1
MNYGTRKNSDYENFEIKKEIEKIGIEIIAEIPYEEKLHLAEIAGKSFFELENDLQAVKKIEKMIEIIY